jgi:deoxyhypusine monooxygenase
MVRETCELARAQIMWMKETNSGETEELDLTKLMVTTNDPAPPFNYKKDEKYADIPYLTSILLDNENYSLFERYRAMFTLRELHTADSCHAICKTLLPENFDRCSPLLKHEVAFVLAQMEG